MRKKLSAWLLLLLLHVGMAWFLIAAVKHFTEGSSTAPTSSISGWDAVDSVIDDSLPGKDSALRLRTRLSLIIGNEKIGDIYIHDERLLREPVLLDDKSTADTAAAVNGFYNAYSVPTCITVFPCASEIYTECLPENASVPSQLPQIERFYELTDPKIRTIDAYHVLSTFKDDYIYYRTDSRCTVYGAYNVYRSLIRKMGYYPVPYDSCTVSHVKNDLRGDLYEDCLYDKVVPDILDVYTCENSSRILSMNAFDGEERTESSFYCSDALDAGNAENFYMGEPVLFTEIETNVENGKRLLVIKDSFCDSMLPFFTQHYAQLDIIDIGCLDRPITELTDPSEYQQILIMCSSGTLDDCEKFMYITEQEVTGNG